MATQTKAPPRNRAGRSLRQSVSIPAAGATEVRRIARERHLTISRALVTLAERGIQAELYGREIDRLQGVAMSGDAARTSACATKM